METSNASLQNAVRSIKLLFQTKGQQITEEEIADKMNLSYEKFQAYLANKNRIPQYLVDSVLLAYGLKQVVSNSIVYHEIDIPLGLSDNDNGT